MHPFPDFNFSSIWDVICKVLVQPKKIRFVCQTNFSNANNSLRSSLIECPIQTEYDKKLISRWQVIGLRSAWSKNRCSKWHWICCGLNILVFLSRVFNHMICPKNIIAFVFAVDDLIGLSSRSENRCFQMTLDWWSFTPPPQVNCSTINVLQE